MLLILPFEAELYETAGVPNEFVGHYLIEDIPDDLVASEPPADGYLALLPGSRPQEIQRHLHPMLETAAEFCRRHDTRAVVAGIRGAHDYEAELERSGGGRVHVVYDDSRNVIGEARLVLTSSGTATLETAIIARPMVVIYKTGWITYQIARKLVRLDKIALANLVLDEKVVPELIQSEANPRAMLNELERYMNDSDYLDDVTGRLKKTAAVLGGSGASARAAEAIGRFIKR
jgi:lipid-A-disaccharide synthase